MVASRQPTPISPDIEAVETQDWIDALDDVVYGQGPERVRSLLADLQIRAQQAGVELPVTSITPYINTIPVDRQAPYPGDREVERRIKSLIRWNAMAMVVRANKADSSIGGHISSYASSATLYEVGFNHFFRGKDSVRGRDYVYIQGHTAPGIYARAYLEGRLSEDKLVHFRRETAPGGGLSSYPHPWLMPDFWEFPTVSMGLGPITAIYHARFMRYLEDRGLKPRDDSRIWCFLGDGETDEPESLGAITLASREKLDNLIFVVNCNLQRLDGPVRGNGNIIQELEAVFRGSGWNTIKVIWGSEWDALFARDTDRILVKRAGEVVDGEYQKYMVEGGAYIRKHFYGANPRLLDMVKNIPDNELWKMSLGGHDPAKVYAAFKQAVEHRGSPTVILAKTIKGYGLGASGEGKNITHQQKKLNEDELHHFRDRFDIPISDDEVGHAPFYRPPEHTPEIQYLKDRRKSLGGFLPARRTVFPSFELPKETLFDEFLEGTGDREVSTTMAFVRMLGKLLRDPNVGKLIVPIVPDEARTFGMEALFRQAGIYSHVGQLYEPVDADSILYYREARDGQILEEGITEAGAMSSFIAAGTAYANHGVPTIPFFIYYSMFGMQRMGDLAWAAGDQRTRGFLLGGTSGRTTLAGEGLQHQDGHSHVLAATIPNVLAYDPAYAYELAVIIRDGVRRMYVDNESVYYYLTVMNENYPQPAMPTGAEDGILRGMYQFRPAADPAAPLRAQLFGSGAILNEVVKAQAILAERYGVQADVWSVTSYKQLRNDALDADRWNMLHPGEEPRVPYVASALADAQGVLVAASDYMKLMPDMIARWTPRPLRTLGTDGFGRSENREGLRTFFEVDARYVVVATLSALARERELSFEIVSQAIADLGINPEKPNPRVS